MSASVATKEKLEYFVNALKDDEEARLTLGIRGTLETKTLLENEWGICLYKQGVGFIQGSLAANKNLFYVNKLYVLKEQREKGYGKELLKELEKRAKEDWNIDGFYCYTVENPDMVKILVKSGYVNKGTYKDFVRRNGKGYSQTLFIKKA